MTLNLLSISASEKASKVLGLIADLLTSKSKASLTNYTDFNPPTFGTYCFGAVSDEDNVRLERVRLRATKLIANIRNKSYDNIIKQFILSYLEERRLRGDVIQVFKIVKGKDNVRAENFFTLNTNQARNNGLKLSRRRFNLKVGRNYFANRIVNEKNKFPAEAVECNTV